MTFDELWRRSLQCKDPVISSIDSQRLRAFAIRPSANPREDLDETEMNQFLEWLEGTLLIDDVGERGA